MPVTGAYFANKDDLVLKGNNLIALSLCVELYVFMVELVYVLAHIKNIGKIYQRKNYSLQRKTMYCKKSSKKEVEDIKATALN